MSKYSLRQLREMFEPKAASPNASKPVQQIPAGVHRGIPVFRQPSLYASRSKYQPHQGKQECARRWARACIAAGQIIVPSEAA